MRQYGAYWLQSKLRGLMQLCPARNNASSSTSVFLYRVNKVWNWNSLLVWGGILWPALGVVLSDCGLTGTVQAQLLYSLFACDKLHVTYSCSFEGSFLFTNTICLHCIFAVFEHQLACSVGKVLCWSNVFRLLNNFSHNIGCQSISAGCYLKNNLTSYCALTEFSTSP